MTIVNQAPPFTAAYARELVRRVRYLRGSQRSGGPPSVATNLLLGLRRAGIPYRFNPGARLGRRVGVLSHVDTLRHAIELKRRGSVDLLIAGPNIVVAPNRNDGVLRAPEIDRVVVASAWVRDMFLSFAPELRERIAVWPVGVDEEHWTPTDAPRVKDVLIYAKSGPAELLAACEDALDGRGLRHTLVTYGSYAPNEYRALLRSHRWMLFLSESETQGIALLEAWSCDTPTLVWDRGRCLFEDIDWPGASSAPYLDRANGRAFAAAAELPSAIEEMETASFAPRQFVLRAFTARQRALEYAGLFDPGVPAQS